MRNSALAMAIAAALPCLAPSPAGATMPTETSSLRDAAGAMAAVENVGCWAFGWRGWGWYPGLFRCAGPLYAPGYVVAPAPVYAPAPAPGRCWIMTDPERNAGYWGAC
jgi:hypothetical protein